MRGKRQEGERDGGEKEQQLERRDGSGRRGGGGLILRRSLAHLRSVKKKEERQLCSTKKNDVGIGKREEQRQAEPLFILSYLMI